MPIDVLDLRSFYASPLGHVAKRFIGEAAVQAWGSPEGLSLLGIGYATPYLTSWRAQAERTLAFMPAAQGVIAWPDGQASVTALVDPYDLPLPDGSIDRVIIVHALEAVDSPADLLGEVWRVLAPGGRVLIVAPNRRGLWARMDTTPFGDGRPFSRRQLTVLLREALFSPEQWTEALFMPPVPRRMFWRAAAVWERIGRAVAVPMGGVHIIDAIEHMHRPAPVRARRHLGFNLRPMLLPDRMPAPEAGRTPPAA
jgi:SAM-dependent methyltransferase